MLYEMITARLPFEAPTIMALLSKHLIEHPPAPSQRRPDLGLPPAIDELVMTAMAKEVNARPPTMEAFGERIAAYLQTLPVDSTQGTAQRSAMVNVPSGYNPSSGYPSQPAFTPPPPPAGFAPSVPPPAYPAPSAGTGHAPTPAPMGAPMHPVATQPVGHYTPPPQHPQYGQPPAMAKKSGSGLLIIIVIGVVVVGALTATVLLLNRSSSKTVIDSGLVDPEDSDADIDDDDDDDPPNDLGGKTVKLPNLPGTAVAIGQGAQFVVPPDFKHETSADGVIAEDARGIYIVAGPVETAASDLPGMIKEYESNTNSKVEHQQNEVVQGAKRPMATFLGEVKGVKVRHVAVLFTGRSYALFVALIVPLDLTQDKTIQGLADEIVEKRLVLPDAKP
jgi:hypothetical protein